jgi:hypothetical protein
MDCDRFLELLVPYLDGKLGDRDLREQTDHHSHQCPECGEELAILRRALEP